MPASLRIPAFALLLTLSLTIGQPLLPVRAQMDSSQTSAATRALSWLAKNQYPNGSYGPYSQIQTAPAAYALWLSSSTSPKALAGFTWMASEFDNETSGIWYEADIPGEILYTLALSNNLGLLADSTTDYARLLALQQSNSGFQGWYENGQTVTSSIDTGFAVLGLLNARTPFSSNQSAIDYLLTLQNPDASFNLTSSTRSDQYSSLGPEPIAITAIVTLALKDASYPIDAASVSKALNYLRQAASGNFGGHVYAAALSALALNKYNMVDEASKATAFLMSNQNADGGFRDEIRASENSNPLDTGWAAIALQLVQSGSVRSPGLEPVMIATIIIVAAVVAAAIIAAVFVYSRKRGRMGPSIQ